MTSSDRSFCVAKYPKRNYRLKSQVSQKNPTGWGETGPEGDNPTYASFPEWTYLVGYDEGHHCDCSLQTLHNMAPQNALKNDGGDGGKAVWKGCGDCTGGSHWGCCGCCIMKWSEVNKPDCCNPQGNDKQDSGIYCDPAWCPFSPSCLADSSPDVRGLYQDYCSSHPLDQECLKVCQSYNNATDIAKAPPWCSAFMAAYCQLKSPTNTAENMTVADKMLCACQFHRTGSDECLWPDCVNAPPGSAWMTPKQWANQTTPNYCTNACRALSPSVADSTNSVINSSIYQQVCPQVPLPPPRPSGGDSAAKKADGGASDSGGGASESWGDWFQSKWGSVRDWSQDQPWWVWVLIGLGCLVVLGVMFRGGSKNPSSAPVSLRPSPPVSLRPSPPPSGPPPPVSS